MATFNEDIVGGRGFGMGGDGMGGGLIGGLLIGALLGNNGGLFNGNRRDGSDCSHCVTNESLNQQTLGDIKAAIPLAEAQVQLAMAGLQASLSSQATQDTQYLSSQTNALSLAQMQLAAGLSREIGAVDTNVDRQSTAIQQAIFADGERTRQLITNNRISDLEQQLTVSQLRETEQRSINREQVNSHNVTVTMNQAQAQQQQQMQALQYQFAQLCNGVSQVARATNSQVVVGSTGVAGTQTASPTNVAA